MLKRKTNQNEHIEAQSQQQYEQCGSIECLAKRKKINKMYRIHTFKMSILIKVDVLRQYDASPLSGLCKLLLNVFDMIFLHLSFMYINMCSRLNA